MNLLEYCELTEKSVFEYVPLTFVLDTAGRSYKSELAKFESIFNTFEKHKEGNKQELNQALSKFKVRGANIKFPNSKFEV